MTHESAMARLTLEVRQRDHRLSRRRERPRAANQIAAEQTFASRARELHHRHGGTAHEAVGIAQRLLRLEVIVAFAEQQSRKIRSVLPGDTGDQRRLRHARPPRLSGMD